MTVNVVFPRTLAEAIDVYVGKFMEQNPGVVIRRSDIVRMAVERLVRPSAELAPPEVEKAKAPLRKARG